MTRVTDPDLVSMLFRTIAERDEMRATTCLDGREADEDDGGGAGDLPADSRYEAAVTEHIRKTGGESCCEDEERRPAFAFNAEPRLLPGTEREVRQRASLSPASIPASPRRPTSRDFKTTSTSSSREREQGPGRPADGDWIHSFSPLFFTGFSLLPQFSSDPIFRTAAGVPHILLTC